MASTGRSEENRVKISAIKLHVVEVPGRSERILELVQVPTVRRIQYTHRSRPKDGPFHELILRVQTDDGVEGLCNVETDLYSNGMEHMLALLRTQVLGQDPFDREGIWQKLQLGTRWLYQKPGWFGPLDNCLWDILGKVAGLPLFKVFGKVREGLSVYQTAGDGPLETYIEHIEQGKELGIRAYKPHSYKGGEADIPIMEKLRAHVGPDYDLLLDPVCSYTLREAIEVGRVLEALDFVWLEEPFHEQKMHQYQELCRELTIPVMANEMLMHDIGLSAEWLIQGATDRLRANARHGATQVLKLAHLAELHGTNIELNGTGGLYGLVHAHLGCAIANTDFYEYGVGGYAHRLGPEVGMTNPPQIVDGYLLPPDLAGWGAAWDMDYLLKHTVAVL
jgi:L-alanine-DL-glutamate epimerase-like enolase superfamily enzyme